MEFPLLNEPIDQTLRPIHCSPATQIKSSRHLGNVRRLEFNQSVQIVVRLKREVKLGLGPQDEAVVGQIYYIVTILLAVFLS